MSELLRLDSNEGAVPAELSLATMAQPAELVGRYPDGSELAAALARRFGVAADQVVITAGADEALDRVCRTYLDRRTAVLPEPTFGMLRHYIGLAGGAVRSIAWPQGPFPCDDVVRAVDGSVGAVFVVSPNNPTGATASVADLQRVAAAARHAVVVLDAAYGEFADDDLTAIALTMPNVIVVRTFSKAFGLAGCRVGYLLARDREIAAVLRDAAGPYPVAGLSLAIAQQRLRDDIRPFVRRIRFEVAELRSLLHQLGAECPPSAANFVLATFRDAAFVYHGLLSFGV